MAASEDAHRLSDAIVAFSVDGRFPEDIAELPSVTGDSLQPSIDKLEQARQKLEEEIHVINEETKEDVSSWVRNAKTLQEDIIRSKTMASDIVRQSEAPDVSGEAIQDAEDKIEFLNREVQYSQQLHGVLGGLQRANQLLNQVEQARDEQRILGSLKLLEQAWAALDQVGAGKSCRAMRLLDIRSFELKSAVHEVFDQLWKSLVEFDIEGHKIAVHSQVSGGTMTLSDAVLGLKAYKEVDERIEQFWRNLDTVIISPRMQLKQPKYSRIVANNDTLQLIGTANGSVEALMGDLTTMFTFLSSKLPKELLRPLTALMMNEIIPRLVNDWLNSEVPSSLQNMKHFQRLIQHTKQFCLMLKKNGYAQFEDLVTWVNKAPMNWLGKCRDTALDNVRERLTGGIASSRAVEKVEKHTVSIAEGRELTTTTGAGAAADKADWGEDWGDNWDEDAEEQNDVSISQVTSSQPSSRAPTSKSKPTTQPRTPKDEGEDWGWGEEDNNNNNNAKQDDDDGGDEAWGWGEEDNEPVSPFVRAAPPPKPVARPVRTQVASPVRKVTPSLTPQSPSPKPAMRPFGKTTPSPSPRAPSSTISKPPAAKATPPPAKKPTAPRQRQEQTRELILRETYHISSMPDPVLQLIFNILEDAAALTKDNGEYELLAGTAPGLFGLPTFALALFRSISPYYYSLGDGGNMFLYNDAMYLAEQLTEFSSKWKDRADLTPKAKTMLRLDNDVKTLQSFANRSYAAEMSTQKTVLQDLLGGSQGIQDDVKAAVEAGTSRIQVVAATWEPILARSVWTQAIGSLTDSLATHLINEVLEMSSIGQDEAYNIADAISSAEELDKFFLPSNLLPPEQQKQHHPADEIPLTDRYAPNWLRLKYLSQVLQSNLADVKYLWCEGQLSLYFSASEVVDLVHASFEDNPKTRETIRDIEAKPALSNY